MRLSEAIRLGAMAVPAVRGPVFSRGRGGRICGACAIGAALYAVGATANKDVEDALYRNYSPHLPALAAIVPHPVNHRVQSVCSTIIDLFEEHRWTREQVADWAETWEAQQDAAVPVLVESA